MCWSGQTTESRANLRPTITGIVSMPVNPNEIPPSPSPSAQLRLSHYEPAPSVATSESRSSPATPPRTPPAPLPPIETIPDIPDYRSKSTARPPLLYRHLPLGVLGSRNYQCWRARGQVLATKSSRTPQPMDTASVVTYPALRPSPESEKSLSSTSSTSSASTVKPRPRPAISCKPSTVVYFIACPTGDSDGSRIGSW
jgi:hypothetical protein